VGLKEFGEQAAVLIAERLGQSALGVRPVTGSYPRTSVDQSAAGAVVKSWGVIGHVGQERDSSRTAAEESRERPSALRLRIVAPSTDLEVKRTGVSEQDRKSVV